MARFLSAAVASLLLLVDQSSSSSLRSISGHDQNRRLSYELLASYEPNTQVTDHNAIDLDQSEMEDQLAIGSQVGFDKAYKIYEQGGHSKSVASVTLISPLTRRMDKNADVKGVSADGTAIYGKLHDTYVNGETKIEITYKTTDQQKSYVNCQVGGLPRPNLQGCFAASGSLEIDSVSMQYSYNPNTENVNKRTLKYFSTSAEEKMYRCETCPYSTFEKFRDYYGYFDYADKWVQAAFKADSTPFEQGIANFRKYEFKARAEAIQKATAYMSVWMFVIRELENALDYCKIDCKEAGCNDETVRAWDKAVALYTGSLEGIDGQGSGKLLYALADKRCREFKTCGDLAKDTEGRSHVNEEIFRAFTLGSRMLKNGDCVTGREYKTKIENMMTIPLIQGTLRYAYITNTNNNAGQKAEAEGATFAGSVLPIVAKCNQDAAETIYQNMKTGQGNSADFVAVKKAFESVYECMGIRGADVGGLWDEINGVYFAGAAPLQTSVQSSGSANIPLIIGCTAGGLIAGIIVYMFVSKCCCSNKVVTETKENPAADDAEIMPSVVSNETDVLPSVDSQHEPVEIS